MPAEDDRLMCLAAEWQRDARGWWAMRECQSYASHNVDGSAHAFGAWRYGVQLPPAPAREVTRAV